MLPSNYAINTILKRRYSKNTSLHYLSLKNITSKQRLKIKSSIIDTNNHFNEIFPSFDSLNSKFSSGFRLIDNFSTHFLFHWANCKNKESKASHLCNLDNIFSNASLDLKTIVVVSEASIRKNIAISISHVHSFPNDIRKTIYYAINITLTKAKLSTIRCGVNQAIQIPDTTCIVIMDFIYIAKYIFDFFIYLYQLQLITIAKNLRMFFLNTHWMQ